MSPAVDIVINTIEKGANNTQRATDNFKKLKTEVGTIAPGLENARKSLTGFLQQNAALVGVLVGVGVVLNKISKDTVKYANDVRALSQISGESTENSSRFIQVLDDYKISAEDALVATRALTSKGYAPNIDTLATLSDKYLALNTVEEKNKFVLENLGRSGLQWVEVLNKGSEAIRRQGDGINKNLILSQKQVDAARALEIAQDNLNDAQQAVSVTLGNKLIPLQAQFLNGVNVYIRGIQIASEENISFGDALDKAGYEIWQEQQAMLANKDAAKENAEGIGDLAQSQKDAEESARNLSNVFSGLLSSMSSIQDANDNYQKSVNDITKSDEDLKNKKQQLTYEWYKQTQAGEDTVDAYNKYMQSLSDVSQAERDNADKKAQLEEDVKQSAKERLVSRAQELVSVDGVSEKEFQWLEELKVSHGLVSRAAADQAIAEEQAAQSLVSGFEQTLSPMEQSLAIMQQIAAYNGTRVSFGVNYSSNLPGQSHGNTYGTNGQNYSQMFTSGQSNPMSVPNASHAMGTDGWLTVPPGHPNDSYTVGLTSGEKYSVNQSGKGMGGDVYNINVYNAVPEKASDSIRKALISKSATGRSS